MILAFSAMGLIGQAITNPFSLSTLVEREKKG